MSPLAVSVAATSPPLSATPGGVTSRQVADLAGRTNTSQNVGLDDIGTIAQLSLAVLSEVASETAGALAAAEPAGEDADDEDEPHAASAAVDAMAATAAASALRRTRRAAGRGRGARWWSSLVLSHRLEHGVGQQRRERGLGGVRAGSRIVADLLL